MKRAVGNEYETKSVKNPMGSDVLEGRNGREPVGFSVGRCMSHEYGISFGVASLEINKIREFRK